MRTPTDLRSQLDADGYVVVESIYDENDFAPLYDEWNAILDGIVDRLRAEGSLTESFDGLRFSERLLAVFTASSRNIMQPFDISLPQKNITADTPLHVSPTIFRLLTHDRLLDAVEQLIGPEIVSNPVQHVRMKLPHRALTQEGAASYQAAQVPWHQDLAVVLEEADESTILSCWVAVTEATEENGCLRVVPQSHRDDLIEHCLGDPQLGIPEKLVPTELGMSVPMRAGSVLLFDQRLIHGSLDNTTEDEVRISMDLRYHPDGQPSGRPAFPSFLARSRRSPERVLTDPAVWADMWHSTRARLAEAGAPTFNRWDPDSLTCA